MDDSNLNHHAVVGEALSILIPGLTPFVARVLREAAPHIVDWTVVLAHKDRQAGKRDLRYTQHDLQSLLRAMTEHLGDLGYPFERSLSRTGRNYASELRDVRNRWAHTEPFTAPEAYRALDSMELLLRIIAADDEADRIEALKLPLLPTRETVGPPNENVRSGTPSEPTTEAPAPANVSVEIISHPFLSYPMAVTRIPVVSEITIANAPRAMRGATVEVDIACGVGPLGDPKVFIVDLAVDSPTVLRDVSPTLDPQRMLSLDTQLPGVIRTTVRSAEGELLALVSTEVQVLAGNQWVSEPPQLALELLAAHVQPNAPVLGPLLLEASDRLGLKTGSTALDGYQSESPERVDAIVESIFDALRARDIRYAEPPASWGLSGQQVRTPSEVLEDRFGTCLDTTVTMAAALEQAGINSTLWLAKGHIFLGYWREDSSLGTVATVEPMDFANLVDLGLIGLVETTMLTGGEEGKSFGEANRQPRIAYLDDRPSELLGIVDIKSARLHKIFPLPSRSLLPNGSVEISEYRAAALATIMPYYGQQAGTGNATEHAAAPRRVQLWKNALLDLSLRNKLINYTDRAGYHLEVPAPAIASFEDAINAGTRIALRPSDDIPTVDRARGIRFARDLPEQTREEMLATKRRTYIDVTAASYTTRLRALAYKAKTIAEETGANNLYLAFGMLNWKLADRELRSPLVLVPVNLVTANRGQEYRLELDEAGASTPNYCLLEKLRIAFGLEIPGLANPVEDDSGIDLAAALRSTREALASAGLPFRVEETCDLAILQFAKFRLWKDLDENWEALAENTLVAHLINTPLDPFVDPVSQSAGTNLDQLAEQVPVSADASQLDAIGDAVAGRTFVLEGPPGTGKSQTITNLLARALASGKRVLFVAEKRAALDVVKTRLESVGLGDLSLDLHDKAARPSAVRTQIKRALDLTMHADRAKFEADAEAAARSRRTLERYADRLHESNPSGLSLYSARTTLLALDSAAPTFDVPRALTATSTSESIEALRSILRELPETADLARPRRYHPWGFTDEQQNAPLDAADLYTRAAAFDTALSAVLNLGIPLDELALHTEPSSLANWPNVAHAPRHPLYLIDALGEPNWLAYRSTVVAEVTASPTPSWTAQLHPTVLAADMRAIHAAAIRADDSKFFGRKKRRQQVLDLLRDWLVVSESAIHLKTLSQLTASVVETLDAVEGLRAKIAAIPLPLIDAGWNPFLDIDRETFAKRLAWVDWLVSEFAGQTDPKVVTLRKYFERTAQGEGAEAISEFVVAWQRFAELACIDSSVGQDWLDGTGFLHRWMSTRGERRFSETDRGALDRWLAFTRALEPVRVAGLTEAYLALRHGSINAEDAVVAFDKGKAIASIGERAESTSLNAFDVDAHEKTIERFTSTTRALRAQLPQIIPAELLATRRFDTQSAGGMVGGLRRQLERQRGGMTVRAMLEHYGDLITQIMPCTLMSPESVARFFPARSDLFDIVVFDEASQIRVADAIGAMGRGRSVIVVGDSKQMPPTSFAESGTTTDEVNEVTVENVVDEESILSESVQAQVPRKWLSWHYRSQDEALIAFSNHHYYEDRLSSFPAPMSQTADDGLNGHGVSLVRVPGQFLRSGAGKTLRTNPIEAEAIVDEVRRRFAASPDELPSLGIITFNAPQRNWIENLLRDTQDERILIALDSPDGLFVKNLENVQGDERDTILFSVAFSVNDKGVLPLNFGPLSLPGGERRLNVAVTRARRQVILFASFDPEQLRAEQTNSYGVKHLRAYLELAARGVESTTGNGRRIRSIDRHRDEIAEHLQYRGYIVHTDVGLSDFRVDLSIAEASEPDRPLVAVLLDGENWRTRQTVADRDGLPAEVLGNLMRWPGVTRIWLPEWLHDRDGALDRLEREIEQAKAKSAERSLTHNRTEPLAVADSASIVEASTNSSSAGSTWADADQPMAFRSVPRAAPAAHRKHQDELEFTEWEEVGRGTIETLDRLPARDASQLVENAIRRAVETEGPIHTVRLAKLVARSFGLERVASTRATAILKCVPSEFKRSTGERTFFWPAALNPESWLGARRVTDGGSRDIEAVSLVEIANAMRIAAAQSGGMASDELKREALGMFGGKRITSAIATRLDDGLEFALASGRLRRDRDDIMKDGRY